ncbi:MAG TPA: LptA/OstA family protein [Caulobacteraceae bacterium]|jgi:lipopolysaccharide export system protein LptA|nr:LptA/OstA family protein [Caulobacteraceae bacterium]
MRRARAIWPGLAVAAALGAAGLVRAQIETRSNAPIDITANEAEVVNAKCLAIWRGAAEALQGDTRLRADTITVHQAIKGGKDGASCGATQEIVAEGDVYYVTPTQNARGDRAVYSAATDQIVMTGDVIVVQGKDVARGDRLVIKVSTKRFTMESNARGARAPHRVRGVFYPERQNDTAAPPASPPAP